LIHTIINRWSKIPGLDRLKSELSFAEKRLSQVEKEIPPLLESLDEEGSLRVSTCRTVVQGALLDLTTTLAHFESSGTSPTTTTKSSTPTDDGISLDDIVVTNKPGSSSNSSGSSSSGSKSSGSKSSSSSGSKRSVKSSSSPKEVEGDPLVAEGDTEVRVSVEKQGKES